MLKAEVVEAAVLEEVRGLRAEEGRPERAFSIDSTFEAIGLDSMNLAELLVRLETRLGGDPFTGDLSIADMRSLKQLAEAFASVATSDAA
jgi:acyl carrier protein